MLKDKIDIHLWQHALQVINRQGASIRGVDR